MTLIDVIENLRAQLRETQDQLNAAREAADQDHFLPVLNRRAFTRELSRHIDLRNRHGTLAHLIFFDLDDFKRVNDTFGHAAGDSVLQHFADILVANMRASDLIGRVGGDEFAVLMSHASAEAAEMKIIALSAILNGTPPRWNDETVDLSFSAGATELLGNDTPATALVRADRAMYARKRDRHLRRISGHAVPILKEARERLLLENAA